MDVAQREARSNPDLSSTSTDQRRLDLLQPEEVKQGR